MYSLLGDKAILSTYTTILGFLLLVVLFGSMATFLAITIFQQPKVNTDNNTTRLLVLLGYTSSTNLREHSNIISL